MYLKIQVEVWRECFGCFFEVRFSQGKIFFEKEMVEGIVVGFLQLLGFVVSIDKFIFSIGDNISQ